MSKCVYCMVLENEMRKYIRSRRKATWFGDRLRCHWGKEYDRGHKWRRLANQRMDRIKERLGEK